MDKHYTSIGLFSGAGGLDLGFEQAGFEHILSNDNDETACNTLSINRPKWKVFCKDARQLDLRGVCPDVVLAGFPCQGFSLGGHRKIEDERNQLYKSAVELVDQCRPRAVVFENVFNLRTMTFDGEISAAEEIRMALSRIGYETTYEMLRCSLYGVPQTRRRFIFVGFRDGLPTNYTLPVGTQKEATCRSALFDSAISSLDPINVSSNVDDPFSWSFQSTAHKSRRRSLSDLSDTQIVPVRLSRTASDGNPVRGFDAPMPALDTGTIWGFAVGDVQAHRYLPDRTKKSNVRNRESQAKLWRIEADLIRKMTSRELANLQTFPADWHFCGSTWGHRLKQIGNAVPVNLARQIGLSVRNGLSSLDYGEPILHTFMNDSSPEQVQLI